MDSALNTLAGGKRWAAYCMSLPSASEARETFTKWAQDNGLTFQFWDAIPASTLTHTDISNNGVQVSWGKIDANATAWRLSHMSLWNHILQSELDLEYVFILEDTAGYLRANKQIFTAYTQAIHQSRPEWSIVQFGFGTMTGLELNLFQRRVPPGIFRVDSTDQTHALFYDRDAIQDMFALGQDEKYRSRPVDGLLMAFIQKKKGHILAPKTAIIERVQALPKIEPRTAPVKSRK